MNILPRFLFIIKYCVQCALYLYENLQWNFIDDNQWSFSKDASVTITINWYFNVETKKKNYIR